MYIAENVYFSDNQNEQVEKAERTGQIFPFFGHYISKANRAYNKISEITQILITEILRNNKYNSIENQKKTGTIRPEGNIVYVSGASLTRELLNKDKEYLFERRIENEELHNLRPKFKAFFNNICRSSGLDKRIIQLIKGLKEIKENESNFFSEEYGLEFVKQNKKYKAKNFLLKLAAVALLDIEKDKFKEIKNKNKIGKIKNFTELNLNGELIKQNKRFNESKSLKKITIEIEGISTAVSELIHSSLWIFKDVDIIGQLLPLIENDIHSGMSDEEKINFAKENTHVNQAVLEILRWRQPAIAQLNRTLALDINGREIGFSRFLSFKKGTVFRFSTSEPTHCDDIGKNPYKYDPSRLKEVPKNWTNAPTPFFGHGTSVCPGWTYPRTLLRLLLVEMAVNQLSRKED